MPNLSETGPLHSPTPRNIDIANRKRSSQSLIGRLPGSKALRGFTAAAAVTMGGFVAFHQSVEADCGSTNPTYTCPKDAPIVPPTGSAIPSNGGFYPTPTYGVVPTPSGQGEVDVDIFLDSNLDRVHDGNEQSIPGRRVTWTDMNNNSSTYNIGSTGQSHGLFPAGTLRFQDMGPEDGSRVGFTTNSGLPYVDVTVVPGAVVTAAIGETTASSIILPSPNTNPAVLPNAGGRLPLPPAPDTPIPHTTAVPTKPEKPVLAPTGLSSPDFEIQIEEYLPHEAISASNKIVDFSVIRGNRQVLGAQVVEALPIRGVRYGGVIHDVESFDVTRDPKKASQVQLGNLKFLQGHDEIYQVGKGVMYGIRDVKNGDMVKLDMGDGKVLQYKVDFVGLVNEYEAYLNQHSSEDAVIGLTCNGEDPVYSNDRLVFHAVRADGQTVTSVNPIATATANVNKFSSSLREKFDSVHGSDLNKYFTDKWNSTTGPDLSGLEKALGRNWKSILGGILGGGIAMGGVALGKRRQEAQRIREFEEAHRPKA